MERDSDSQNLCAWTQNESNIQLSNVRPRSINIQWQLLVVYENSMWQTQDGEFGLLLTFMMYRRVLNQSINQSTINQSINQSINRFLFVTSTIAKISEAQVTSRFSIKGNCFGQQKSQTEIHLWAKIDLIFFLFFLISMNEIQPRPGSANSNISGNANFSTDASLYWRFDGTSVHWH